MKTLRKYIIAIVVLALPTLGYGQITVVDQTDAMALANTLIGTESGVTIIDATFTGSPNSSGTFSGGEFGISEGILLTSGHAQIAVGPNLLGGASAGNGMPGHPDLDSITAPFLTADAAILEITFIPSGNTLEFTYVFGSEEYNEYVCSSFNDAFAFIVNGGVYTNQNIALIPGTVPPMPVAINNVNNGSVGSNGSMINCTDSQLANSAFFIDNLGGTNIEYDGYTIPLAAVIAVEPGVEYTILLGIADAGDNALDSGVFLEGESFVSVNCDAGEIAFEGIPVTTWEYCIDNLPLSIDLTNSGDGLNDTYVYFVTDSSGNIVSMSATNAVSTSNWSLGTYYIYGVSYSGNLIGISDSAHIDDISADGCFDIDGPLAVTILDCSGEFDCPDLGLNIGDPCEIAERKGLTQKIMGVVGSGCDCIPVQPGIDCADWRYYFADIASNGVTDIYGVTLNGGFADLTLIVTSNEEAHIALDEVNSLLYLVRKSDGAISTVDVSGPPPVMSPWQSLSIDIPSVVTATMASNGELLIGSQSHDQIYSVDPNTFLVTSYDTYSPIDGGDLAFDSNGKLYLAAQYHLYSNNQAPAPDLLLATLNNVHKVTGLALTNYNTLISSYVGHDQFLVHDLAGNLLSAHDIQLNGVSHTANYGDMTSGCIPPPPSEGICELFTTYYVNHGPGIIGSDLYEVDFIGGNALLTYVTNVPFEAHIAYNATADLIYFVNKNGSFLRFYNPGSDTFLGDLPLVAGMTELTATVYNKMDGYLYVGSQNQDKIYQVDLVTGNYVLTSNAPVSGGDIAIKNNDIYMASRSGNTLYKFVAGIPVLLGNIQPMVTGLVEANNLSGLITSNYGSNDFLEIDETNGNLITTHPAMLNGAPFMLLNGDMASGCADEILPARPAISPTQIESALSSYPNPTIGGSQVVFAPASTGYATLEVFDMNGKSIASLYNGVADEGQEYSIHFDGNALPNGIYIYRLTTQNDVVIHKLMIAR